MKWRGCYLLRGSISGRCHLRCGSQWESTLCILPDISEVVVALKFMRELCSFFRKKSRFLAPFLGFTRILFWQVLLLLSLPHFFAYAPFHLSVPPSFACLSLLSFLPASLVFSLLPFICLRFLSFVSASCHVSVFGSPFPTNLCLPSLSLPSGFIRAGHGRATAQFGECHQSSEYNH